MMMSLVQLLACVRRGHRALSIDG